MEMKICLKGEDCTHLRIERIIKELGGLGGDENGMKKIKTEEEMRKLKRKIKKLGLLVRKFEKEVVDFFDATGYYPCQDPMQIVWGRRKYKACLTIIKKQREKIKKYQKWR